MALDALKGLLKANPYELAKASRKSILWFEQQAFNLVDYEKLRETRLVKGPKRDTRQSITPGYMYMFLYDAKTKDKLPYYDMFPLVLPFRALPDGFIGLNLHYLPYDFRIKLLYRLSEFQSSATLDENTKINYSWQMINGVSRFKAATPCVKRYLYSHVRSPFRIIRSPDWASAAMLPLERFSGSDKFTVWADSLAKM